MAEHEGYIGPATLTVDGRDLAVHVVLDARHEPHDGRLHWYGRLTIGDVIEPTALTSASTVLELRTDGGRARARIGDLDPWGRYRITGVGRPPFSLVEPSLVEPSLDEWADTGGADPIRIRRTPVADRRWGTAGRGGSGSGFRVGDLLLGGGRGFAVITGSGPCGGRCTAPRSEPPITTPSAARPTAARPSDMITGSEPRGGLRTAPRSTPPITILGPVTHRP